MRITGRARPFRPVSKERFRQAQQMTDSADYIRELTEDSEPPSPRRHCGVFEGRKLMRIPHPADILLPPVIVIAGFLALAAMFIFGMVICALIVMALLLYFGAKVALHHARGFFRRLNR